MRADKDAGALSYVENAVLDEGEHLVWRGRPSSGVCAKFDLARSVVGAVSIVAGAAWSIFLIDIVVWMALPGLVAHVFGARLSCRAIISGQAAPVTP